MRATTLYHIAAGIFLLFAVGHTLGFLKFKPATPEGNAVRIAMDRQTFSVGGKTFTYGGFYRGFGLMISGHLVFSVLLAWHLGNMAATTPMAIGPLGWAFFGLQVVSLVLSWIYFFPAPVVLSALVAACLGWAAWLTN